MLPSVNKSELNLGSKPVLYPDPNYWLPNLMCTGASVATEGASVALQWARILALSRCLARDSGGVLCCVGESHSQHSGQV